MTFKYPTSFEHRRHAVDRVEQLGRRAYQQYELGEGQGEHWMDDDLEEVLDELYQSEFSHTAALVKAFAAVLGAYMRRLGPVDDQLPEDHLAWVLARTRQALEDDDT